MATPEIDKKCSKARSRSGRKSPQPVPHAPHEWVAGIYFPTGEAEGTFAWCPGFPAQEGDSRTVSHER